MGKITGTRNATQLSCQAYMIDSTDNPGLARAPCYQHMQLFKLYLHTETLLIEGTITSQETFI